MERLDGEKHLSNPTLEVDAATAMLGAGLPSFVNQACGWFPHGDPFGPRGSPQELIFHADSSESRNINRPIGAGRR